MAYIDNIRLKAGNAGTSLLQMSGNEILTLINYAASQGSQGGSGLATTGLDTGGTVQDQIFNNGVTVGVASATDGLINFKNSADGSFITASSTAAKQFSVRNTGDDVEAAINGASESAVAWKVYGNSTVTGQIKTDDITPNTTLLSLGAGETKVWLAAGAAGESALGDVEDVDTGTKVVVSNTAETVYLKADNGVSTSAGLTVGTKFATKTQTISTNTTTDGTMHTILIDASGGAVDITLGSAATYAGVEYYIVAKDLSDVARVLGLITGTYSFATQGEAIIVQSDGSNWRIYGQYLAI